RGGANKPAEAVGRIRPRREREREQEKVEGEKKAPIPIEPEPKFEPIPPPRPKELPPPAPKPPPPPPRVEPPRDPLAESARHVAVGKEAFAAGEYGRAAFRFRKAAETAPDQPMPQFLLAQALLALGKYRDAVNSIQAGLALDPTWPALGPRLALLYAPDNPHFPTHLHPL